MAARLAQLRAQAARAAELASKHGSSYYKEVMEKNKQYVVQPPTVEKVQELSKQLFYTRLARWIALASPLGLWGTASIVRLSVVV